jgi:hypothetical protein
MKKFFIVGCPRSGTTMVQQALNRHSQVVIPPETKFFFSFFGHSHRRQLRHVERLNADLGITLPRPPARVATVAQGRDLYDDMARRYLERLGKGGVAYFGEKTPEHTGHMPRIRQLFPDAKIIVLYRDGRDVALSLTKVPWMSRDLYVNFLVWLYYHRVVRDARNAGLPDLYFARYEDIVADPEAELGAMLRFLDLPGEPAVARGWGNSEGIPRREYAWKRRALEKISTDRVGLFRQELSDFQVGVLERLGGPALASLGYDLLTDGKRRLPLGVLLRASFNLSRLVYRLPWSAVASELLVRVFGPPPSAEPPAPPVPATPAC